MGNKVDFSCRQTLSIFTTGFAEVQMQAVGAEPVT